MLRLSIQNTQPQDILISITGLERKRQKRKKEKETLWANQAEGGLDLIGKEEPASLDFSLYCFAPEENGTEVCNTLQGRNEKVGLYIQQTAIKSKGPDELLSAGKALGTAFPMSPSEESHCRMAFMPPECQVTALVVDTDHPPAPG